MTNRTKPYKVISHSSIRVNLTQTNLEMLKRHQKLLQESRGFKASASSIINECLHKYLKAEV